MDNKKIILDFLKKYFKVRVNQHGEWTIYNLLDKSLSLANVLEEINDIFGNDGNYRQIMYQWLKSCKDSISAPIINYLESYYVSMGKLGWSIYKLGSNEKFIKEKYYDNFKNQYEESLLEKVFDDWFYNKKVSINEKIL